MIMNYAGKNMDVTDALRNVTEKKMGKLDKYFQKDIEGNVTFSSEKNRKIIEVTINLPGTIIRAEESSDDMYASIDKAVDVLERQIRTIRFENVLPLEQEDNPDEDVPKLVKTKKFFLKPMTSEEAVLQMELLGHNFFVYMDGDTGSVNVVYKRKDNNYGLIEPEI